MVSVGSKTRMPRANARRLTESYCNLRTHKEKICAGTKRMFTNARSLVNTMTEMELLIHEEDFDFMGISKIGFDLLVTVQWYFLYWRDMLDRIGERV